MSLQVEKNLCRCIKLVRSCQIDKMSDICSRVYAESHHRWGSVCLPESVQNVTPLVIPRTVRAHPCNEPQISVVICPVSHVHAGRLRSLWLGEASGPVLALDFYHRLEHLNTYIAIQGVQRAGRIDWLESGTAISWRHTNLPSICDARISPMHPCTTKQSVHK